MKDNKHTGILTSLIILAVSVIFAGSIQAYNYGTGEYGDCVYGGEIGDAALSFAVNTTSVSLSNVSTTTTKTATALFSAAVSCTNSGYSVTVNGNPPNGGSYTLTNLTTPTASSTGTEQFGINLVANTSPSVGASPTGGIGTAASGYSTPNQFKYISGNTIASASGNSAQTDYTISFIVNVSSVTPAREYTTTLTLICTATY